jgi:hypothetical protein
MLLATLVRELCGAVKIKSFPGSGSEKEAKVT